MSNLSYVVCGTSSKWSQIIGLAFFFFIESDLFNESTLFTELVRLWIGLPTMIGWATAATATALKRSLCCWTGKTPKSTEELRWPVWSASIRTKKANLKTIEKNPYKNNVKDILPKGVNGYHTLKCACYENNQYSRPLIQNLILQLKINFSFWELIFLIRVPASQCISWVRKICQVAIERLLKISWQSQDLDFRKSIVPSCWT